VKATEYKIQWIHGKRKPGVDECDQGWLNVRRESHIDYTNLLQVVNECFALEAASDGAYTYRVVTRHGDQDRLVA
jgi:hypothetical protein